MTKIVVCVMAGLLFALVPVGPAQSVDGPSLAPDALMVDDDRAQCPDARFKKIQQAVDEAAAGDTVTVCPGLYVERVVVDKPLTLSGDSPGLGSEACQDTATSVVGDLDIREYAVVRPPALNKDVWLGDPLPGSAVTLAADGARLTGFVVEGAPNASVAGTAPDGSAVSFYPGAVATRPDHSGYRIDHNLIRLNTLGIEATSDGSLPTSVDHNCLRENTWGIANQRYPLSNADVEHNGTAKTAIFAFEIGWRVAPMSSVTFAANTSLGDNTTYRVENSKDIELIENAVTGAISAITVQRQNDGLLIEGNMITGNGASLRGIAVPGFTTVPVPPPPPGTTGLRIEGNAITGIKSIVPSGSGIVLAANAGVNGASITGNTVSRNTFGGILVAASATLTHLEGNVANENGTVGISVGGAGNSVVGNEMLGNGTHDARELGVNTWIANECATDNVGGAICGTAP